MIDHVLLSEVAVTGDEVCGHSGGRPDERGAPGCGEVGGRHLIEAAEVRHPPQVVQQPEQRVAVRTSTPAPPPSSPSSRC